jgi:hypothetical protein
LEIPLKRPREEEDRFSPDFVDLTHKLRQAIK